MRSQCYHGIGFLGLGLAVGTGVFCATQKTNDGSYSNDELTYRQILVGVLSGGLTMGLFVSLYGKSL